MKLGKRYLRCKRCHRKLKTDEAQKRGYGHYCFQQYMAEKKKNTKTLFDIAEEMEHKNKK